MKKMKGKLSVLRRQICKDNPEIIKNISEKLKQTYKNNPGIRKRQAETLKRTYKNNPEIIEKAHDRAYRTLKQRGFISKFEQQMIQLLKDKYRVDDIIEQYRDIRYSKPGTKYKYTCDCYIKSLDLFIEYSGSRFHHREEDRDKLEKEVSAFKQKYPSKDIKECQANALIEIIDSDKIKQQAAKDSNLNYITVTEGFKELYENKIL